MKKVRKIIGLLLCILLCGGLFAGCTKEKEEPAQEEQVEKEEPAEKPVEKPETEKEEKEEPVDPSREITLYYADQQTGDMTTTTVSIKNEKDIWNALKEYGILSEDCELNQMTIDKENRTIDLDFNEATGKRVRGMGTTGEYQIVGSIVNTFLEAYDCDSIKLTEEGNVFQSGHAIYDGYNERYTF